MYIQQCLKFNDLQLHPTWWVPLSLRIQATFPDTITYVLLLILSLAPKMKIKTHAWTHIKILLICWIWVYYMYILAYQIKKSSLSCHIGQSFSKLSNLIWSLNGWLFSTFFFLYTAGIHSLNMKKKNLGIVHPLGRSHKIHLFGNKIMTSKLMYR